jgi:hypothetical protein
MADYKSFQSSYWENYNKYEKEHWGISCVLPDVPIIFYNDGSWVPVSEASKRQLISHLTYLYNCGYIGITDIAEAWSYPMPQGEIASAMFEAELERMDDMEIHPLVDEIRAELKKYDKRKI